MSASVSRSPSVGWIGAGRMGAAMATRLLAVGVDVTVYNRTRAKTAPLAAKGAQVAGDVAELADRDIVFSMVSTSADFDEVMRGTGGLLVQPCTPGIVIDSSTVSTEVSLAIRQHASDRGVQLLAAPVSGNPGVIADGHASMAVSGEWEAFRSVCGMLNHIAPSVTWVGDGEQARLVKIAHNVLLGVLTQSLAEVTVLAERGGVPRSAFLAFINDSVLGSAFTRYKTPALVELDFTPTFTTTLLRKDLGLGLAASQSLQTTLPLAAATYQLVQTAIGAGHGDLDFAALLLEQARAAGYEPAPEKPVVVADRAS